MAEFDKATVQQMIDQAIRAERERHITTLQGAVLALQEMNKTDASSEMSAEAIRVTAAAEFALKTYLTGLERFDEFLNQSQTDLES